MEGGFAVRQGENHIKIRDRQKPGSMFFEPFRFGERLTLRAVPIAAGIVADPEIPAMVTLIHMTAESGGATNFDGMHDPLLLCVHAPGILFTIRGPYRRKISPSSSAGLSIAVRRMDSGTDHVKLLVLKGKGAII